MLKLLLLKIFLSIGCIAISVNSYATSKIKVLHDNVTLQDIFPEVTSQEEVMKAPALGRYIILDRGTLKELAQKYQIPSTLIPQEGLVIEREAQEIPLDLLKERVRAELADVIQHDMDIVFDRHVHKLAVTEGEDQSWVLTNVHYNPTTKRFKGSLVTSHNTPPLIIGGRLIDILQVPVLTRSLTTGETIQESDLTWMAVESHRINKSTITDPQALIGAAPRYGILKEKTILRTHDIKAPQWITKGDMVDVFYETPYMSLTMTGQALDNGTKDQTIRVLNPTSHKTLAVRVAAPHKATALQNWSYP